MRQLATTMNTFQSTTRTPFQKAFDTNQTTTSTALPADTLASAGSPANTFATTAKAVKFMVFGTNAANETGIVALIGWRVTSGPVATKLWVPEMLFEATFTLGADVGLAGGLVINTEFFADTVATVVGPPGYETFSDAGDERATVCVPHRGCGRYGFLFNINSSSTNLNALHCCF